MTDSGRVFMPDESAKRHSAVSKADEEGAYELEAPVAGVFENWRTWKKSVKALTPKELEKIFDAVADQAHVGVKRVSAQQEKAAWLRRGSSAVEAVAGIGEMVIQEQAAAKLQAAARGGGQRKGAGKK